MILVIFISNRKWWEIIRANADSEDQPSLNDIKETYEAEIASLNQKLHDSQRDAESLQRRIDTVEKKNKDCENSIKNLHRENEKLLATVSKIDSENSELKAMNSEIKSEAKLDRDKYRELINSEKKRYAPFINIPDLGLDKKDRIIDWVNEYYENTIEINPKALNSLKKETRNIDWHKLCKMIHYIAGYTILRRENRLLNGFKTEELRNYDPDDIGCTVDDCGRETLNQYKDDYSITIDKAGKQESSYDAACKNRKTRRCRYDKSILLL